MDVLQCVLCEFAEQVETDSNFSSCPKMKRLSIVLVLQGICGLALAQPSGWFCNPSFYGQLDGCDCECGAVDPDCSVPGQSLFNCNIGDVCINGFCFDTDPIAPPPDGGNGVLIALSSLGGILGSIVGLAAWLGACTSPMCCTRPSPDGDEEGWKPGSFVPDESRGWNMGSWKPEPPPYTMRIQLDNDEDIEDIPAALPVS